MGYTLYTLPITTMFRVDFLSSLLPALIIIVGLLLCYLLYIYYNKYCSRNNFSNILPPIKSAFSDNIIALVFASDNKYAPYTAVALQSILDNKSPHYNYDIVILENSISRRNKTLMTRMCEKHNNVSLRFVDMEKVYKRERCDKKELYTGRGNYFSISIYNRLFIPDMFSNYKRVVYLDSDVLIRTDLTSLLKIDMDNHAIAGVDDMIKDTWRPEKAYGFDEAARHINSGFLLFNIEECRKTKFLSSCLETLRKLKTPVQQDQEIINTTYENRIKRLDWRYNFLANWLDNRPDVYKYIPKDSIDNIEILHFAGYRPWDWKSGASATVIEWHEYARETPYYNGFIRKYKSWFPKYRFWLLSKLRRNLRCKVKYKKKYDGLAKKKVLYKNNKT